MVPENQFEDVAYKRLAEIPNMALAFSVVPEGVIPNHGNTESDKTSQSNELEELTDKV
jgi:hypothetical protein